MVDKISPVSNIYELYNNKKKNPHDRGKKNKPKFTPPPDNAG